MRTRRDHLDPTHTTVYAVSEPRRWDERPSCTTATSKAEETNKNVCESVIHNLKFTSFFFASVKPDQITNTKNVFVSRAAYNG